MQKTYHSISFLDCGDPPPITVGVAAPITGTSPYGPGDTITYNCDPAYGLRGTSENVCQNDFSWSLAASSVPKCISRKLVQNENFRRMQFVKALQHASVQKHFCIVF